MTFPRIPVALLATTAALAAAAFASADPVGDQFQISQQGSSPATDRVFGPDVAYNSVRKEHLVVWAGLGPNVTAEIFAQRITQDGTRVGTAVQLSGAGNEDSDNQPASVAYDPSRDQYLVTWDTDTDVRARRVAGDGAPLGATDTVISDSVFDDIETTQAVFDGARKRFMVVWKGTLPTPVNQQAFAQVVAGEGDLTGLDRQVTTLADGIDDAVDVAYNATDSQFAVVFHAPFGGGGNEDIGLQRIDADGLRVGTEVQLTEGGTSGYQQPPRVEWNSVRNEYLVAWAGESLVYGTDGEYEILIQRVSGAGAEIGAETRVTDFGPAGNTSYAPSRPDIAFHPDAGEYLLTFHADDDTPPLIDEATEVFGQRLSGTGEQIGTNDFRISETLPENDAGRDAVRPRVAYDSDTCDYLTVWQRSYDSTVPVQEAEILGRRIDGPLCLPRATAEPAISGTAQEGQTLTCAPGTYRFSDQIVVAWLRDGQPIDGATGTTYGVTAADVGRAISCRSTATNATGSTSQTSPTVTPVAKSTTTTNTNTTQYVIPKPIARVRVKSLSVKVAPKRDRRSPYRYRTTGKVTLPAGIKASDGCAGKISVQIKRGKKTVSTRRVKLRANCTYLSRVTFTSKRLKGRGRLKVTVRFLGNSRLLPKTAKPVYVRFR